MAESFQVPNRDLGGFDPGGFEYLVQQNFRAIELALGGLFGGGSSGIRAGTGTITGDGVNALEQAVVNHGLGKTPAAAVAGGGSSTFMVCTVDPSSLASTQMTVNVRHFDGTAWTNTTVYTFFWIAIG